MSEEYAYSIVKEFEKLNDNLRKVVEQLDTMNTTQYNTLLELEGIRDQLETLNEREETSDDERKTEN